MLVNSLLIKAYLQRKLGWWGLKIAELGEKESQYYFGEGGGQQVGGVNRLEYRIRNKCLR